MDYNQNAYDNSYEYVEPQKNTIGMVGMILAIVAIFINPLSLMPLAALILSIIGVCQKNKVKGMAIAGIIISIVASILQVTVDSVITIFTAGIGAFAFLC